MSLFVGNISKNVKKSDLEDRFEKFGKCDINYKVPYLSILLLEALPAILLSKLLHYSY